MSFYGKYPVSGGSGGTGSGTVTSVTFTGDGTVLSSTPSSAVTTSGTLTAALATQSANLILSGPATGSPATPTFRSLVAADIPSLSATYLSLAGGTMAGTIAMGGRLITGAGQVYSGNFFRPVGNSSTNAPLPVSAHVDITPVAISTGTGEQDLISYTAPAGALGNNGEYLEFEFGFTTVSHSDNQTFRVYFGATKIFESTFDPIGTPVIVKGKIFKTGTSTQIAFCSQDAQASNWSYNASPTENLNSAIVLKATGQADQSFANQIVNQYLCVKWFPYNN